MVAHGLGTPNVLLSCVDGSGVHVTPDSWTIAAGSPYSVTVNFTTTQTGRCIVNGTGGGTGAAATKYTANFTGQTSITILGATHGIGSCDVLVSIQDTSSPTKRVRPDEITCDSSTYDVVVTFAVAQSGRLVIL